MFVCIAFSVNVGPASRCFGLCLSVLNKETTYLLTYVNDLSICSKDITQGNRVFWRSYLSMYVFVCLSVSLSVWWSVRLLSVRRTVYWVREYCTTWVKLWSSWIQQRFAGLSL